MAQSIWEEYEYLGSSTSHEGAFATVYKVRHRKYGYIRAIRVLKETIADENDEKWKKFLEECQLLLRLGNGGHPNIVRIYQPRLIGTSAFVEMDYVEGKDLNDYIIAKKFISIDEILRFVREISSALAYCHEGIYEFCMDRERDDLRDDPEDGSKVLLDAPTKQRLIDKYKVIHNDIHSKNIMRKQDGSFILLDFGLSIQKGTLVRTGSKKDGGASEYKAPEKYDGKKDPNEQTDIYSLGILMYEMLAGRVPFPYNTDISSTEAEYEVMEQHKKTTPPPIEPLRRSAYELANPGKKYEKDYPDWLEAMIMKCLEKNPEDRYVNGKELYEDIVQKEKAGQEEILKALKNKINAQDKEIENFKNKNSNNINIKELLEENRRLRESFEKFQKQQLQPKGSDSNVEMNTLKAKIRELDNDLKHIKKERVSKYVRITSIIFLIAAIVAIVGINGKDIFKYLANKYLEEKIVGPEIETQEETKTSIIVDSVKPSIEEGEKTEEKTSIIITDPPLVKETYPSYPFGKYKGELNTKYGIPEGNGTMHYTKRVQIAKHARGSNFYSEEGDYLVGSWGNGDIVSGILYDKNGNPKDTMRVGKRLNPYDLKNDKNFD